MSRKKKPRMEYRYYEAPEKCPVLALLGEKWVQNYGYQIDYLHFHNMMEIGVCYYGEGTIVLEDKEIPYDGGAFTVVPKNFPHTTNSKENSLCSWAWLFIDVEGFITKLYKDNSRMAQKLISRINQRAHYSKNEDRPEVAELIKLIIKCMDEKEEFYLEEVKGLTRALLMQIARWNEKDETQEKNAILDDASIALILPALNYIGEISTRASGLKNLRMCATSVRHICAVFFRNPCGCRRWNISTGFGSGQRAKS